MCFTNFSFQITMTLIIFYLFLIFNLFSKLLLTEICLPFTFYFTIFPLLLFTFFFSFTITFYFSFNPCLSPSVYSNQQSTAFATIVSEALFRLWRGTNNITLLGVCPNFRSRTTALYNFLFFLCRFLYLLVREKHRKTLYRFYLIK